MANLLTAAASPADLKSELRRAALGRRKALSPETRAAFTIRLVAEGLRLARLWRPAIVSAFYPVRDEPDTLALLAALAAEGFATALPITNSRAQALTFRLWRPGEPTRPGQMAIPEPLPSALSVDPDLLFTPAACFDRRGHRIGYGAGHYDRSLQRLRALKPIHAVGVAFAACEVAAVPFEAHDEALDAIVTERETIVTRRP
jgi:5-formyltetrahydrofolate cyclo-ligase